MRRISRPRWLAAVAAIVCVFGTGVATAPATAAPAPHIQAGRSCRAGPGVTVSGPHVVFSGFVHCTPYISHGRIFLLAYSGDARVQHFRRRSHAPCTPAEQRCYGTLIYLPNPPGLQTFCTLVDARVGSTSKTGIRVRGKYCRRL